MSRRRKRKRKATAKRYALKRKLKREGIFKAFCAKAQTQKGFF